VETDLECVTYGQLGDLDRAHPFLRRVAVTEDHHPSWFKSLRTCPDAYDDFPCFFYLRNGYRIVASLVLLPDVLTVGSRSIPWAWTGSFFTSPDCRGQGLGQELWGAATRILHQRGITVAGAFANPATTHICRKLGFTVTERVRRLVLLRTARPFLKAHVSSHLLTLLLDAPYRLVSSGLKALTLSRGREWPGMKVEQLVDIDEIAKRLDSSVAPFYREGFHFNDSAEKFLWKISQSGDSQVYLVRDEATGELLIRFVVKSRTFISADKYTGFRLMTLMDYLFFTNSTASYEFLVDALIGLFWRSDAEVLMTVSSSPLLNALLRRRLMIPAGKGVDFWFKTPANFAMPTEAADIANWHFTHFCTDAFSFV